MHAGRVRCGRCRKPFSALDALDEAMRAAVPGAPPQEATLRDALPASPECAPRFDQPIDGQPGSSEPAAQPAAQSDTLAARPPLSAPEEGRTPSAAYEPYAVAAPVRQPRRRGLRDAWPWGLAALVLLGLAAAQAAYFLRSELAVAFPAAKPWLIRACALAGCEVELPRRAERLGVEASDLRAHPSRKDQLLLSATLRNRAPFAMAYPHVELTLTDTADRALARRVLAPREYLRFGEDASAGIAAQSEFQLALAIDADGLAAAGYRLYVFYP